MGTTKNIIMVRHAKSSWVDFTATDFDRVLNERGLRDAPVMGGRLAARQLPIQVILASSAMRTRQTAKLLADAIDFPEDNIIYTELLYHAPATTIDMVIAKLDDGLDTVMIVCHNNGITDWVNEQCDFRIDNMPTCAIAAFSADCSSWQQYGTAAKKLLFIDFPKMQA
jgi:phosphohistidine phosphatase